MAEVWQQWQGIWQQFPHQWGALCKKLLKMAGEAAQLVLHDTPPPLPEDGEWLCQVCGEEFSTRARLKQHQAAKHKYRQPGFYQVPSSRCPFCDLDFRSRHRCLLHLGPKGSQRCAARLAELPVLAPEAMAEVTRTDAAERRRCVQSGCWRSSGPPAVRQPS